MSEMGLIAVGTKSRPGCSSCRVTPSLGEEDFSRVVLQSGRKIASDTLISRAALVAGQIATRETTMAYREVQNGLRTLLVSL